MVGNSSRIGQGLFEHLEKNKKIRGGIKNK